ncbi:hypothetical protein MEN41_01875, partial [Dolichospermum sp. ST_con]|nr:hypothetical protein [Dolichospermum sp. ST_con]
KTQTSTINATNTSNVKVDLIQTVGAAPATGKGKIVGTLFNDVNSNGVQDTWEPVQSGWKVFLDSNGNKQLNAGELSTTTDANGRYIFNDLAPGTYNVTEVLSSGWKQTLPNPGNPIGSETYKLDDANPNGGIAYSSGDTMTFNAFTAKSANEVINSISVGLSSYGNAKAIYLYKDLNGNNAPDSHEKILELATNLTGSSGFANIPITPTTVSGTFFVAALYQGNGSSSTWISRDTDNPAGKSWLAYSGANSFNPSSFSAFAVSGNNWLLRANTPGTLPQIVTVAANQTLSQINFGNQEINTTSNPYFVINDVLVTEANNGSTNAVFTVKLSSASTKVVTVNYATANKTATAVSDYTVSNGLLTFNPGEIEKTINVAVLGDITSESNETFFVNLLNPTNAAISDNQGIGLILSDDTPTISINDMTVVEGKSSQTTLTISLNAVSNKTVTVNYSTTAGTATANLDFTAITGTLTFNPGDTKKTLNIPILNDSLSEADEKFTVTLANPTNAVLGKSTSNVSITDTLQASNTTTLPTNVENLTLTGTAAINGIGNSGDNIIIGNSANNTLTGLGGKDTLTGGAGSDKFNYKNLTDSLLNNFDVITDFNANLGNDLFLVTAKPSNLINPGSVSTLDTAGIGAKLTATNFGANLAAQFTFGSRSFIAMNDTTAGFDAATDAIVEVTGFTEVFNVDNFTIV